MLSIFNSMSLGVMTASECNDKGSVDLIYLEYICNQLCIEQALLGQMLLTTASNQ